MDLTSEDLRNAMVFLGKLKEASEMTDLDLIDGVLYDQGEPLGMVAMDSGVYVLKPIVGPL